MNEFAIIERFFKRQGVRRDDVPLAIGDDAAVIRPAPDRELVVTTDVLVSGVHFPEDTGPDAVGHKALAVNLSDVAAMGAEPAWATMDLTLEQADEAWLEAFCGGFFELAGRHGVELVGGDVTNGPLTVAVQVIGIVGEHGYLTRGGARPNDLIYVSGTLGDAALGLQAVSGMLTAAEPDRTYFAERLQRPSPRVELGRAVAPFATAAIDISDGLAADLGHVCAASGVGAEVELAHLPVSDAYRRCLSRVGWEPAVGFGDDYELCFTVPAHEAATVERFASSLATNVTRIGRISGDTIRWTRDGQPVSVDEQGYQHFR